MSVVIPTFNRSPMVPASIRSVLGQTVATGVETIVVDDGSTDDTVSVLASEFGDRVRVIGQANRGASEARNAGVREARGEWVAFNDSDDVWAPDKLEKQFRFLDAHPDIGLLCGNGIDLTSGARVISPRRARQLACEGGASLGEMLIHSYVRTPTLMVRRDLFLEIGGFDRSLPVCEDSDFFMRALLTHPAAFLDEPLFSMGRTDDHLGKNSERRCECAIRSLEQLVAQGTGVVDRVGVQRLNKSLAYRYYRLGRAYEKSGKRGEAEKAFSVAVAKQPYYGRAIFSLWRRRLARAW